MTERMKGAQGRRRAEGRHRHRPGRRPVAARPGPRLCRGSAEGRRRSCWSAANALKRDTRLLHGAGAVHRHHADMRINREEVFGPVASVIRSRTTTRRWPSPTTRRSACVAGICTTSLKYATHFKRHSQAGMVMVNLPTAGVDYHVPFRRPQGFQLRPARAGPLRAGVLHHGEDGVYAGLTPRCATSPRAAGSMNACCRCRRHAC
jgi:hypothetical protein